jgi:hypothetical protein
MTGGFDSRLLFAMLKRHGFKPVLYTHWQNGKGNDYKIARLLADSENMTLNCIEKHNREDFSATDNMEPGYQYTDGQCRPQYYWNEIYSSFSYLQELNPDALCSLNGVGGEQYRNNEGIHFACSSWSIWLKKRVFPNAANVLDKKLLMILSIPI